MSLEATTSRVAEKAASIGPMGATVKFVIDEGAIFVDGTGDANTVSNDNNEAECEIEVSTADFNSMLDGELNPMMAFMNKQMSIDGDMAVAMKLTQLFS